MECIDQRGTMANFTPANIQEMKEVLKRAENNDKRIVVDNNHQKVHPSEYYVIDMTKLNKILKIDKHVDTVTVEGGALISNLKEEIRPHNLALDIYGIDEHISVGQAISMGAHGTGGTMNAFPSLVTEVKLMTSGGETLTLSRDRNKEMLLAVCSGLGLCGIILSATIQCTASFNTRQMASPVNLDDGEIQTSHTYCNIVFPLIFCICQLLFWISCIFPSLVPSVNRLCLWFLTRHHIIHQSKSLHEKLYLSKPSYSLEWSLPREYTALALKELQWWISNTNLPANIPITVTFVAGDEDSISAAYKMDSTSIKINASRQLWKTADHAKYWSAFTNIMSRAQGRPKWLTLQDNDHLSTAELKQYFPKWERFVELRKRVDPSGRFLHGHWTKILRHKDIKTE